MNQFSSVAKHFAKFGIPGLALFVFLVLLYKFDFTFGNITPGWAAVTAILFLLLAAAITFYCVSLGRNQNTPLPRPVPAPKPRKIDKGAKEILDHLFDEQRLPTLVLEWRDKLLAKAREVNTPQFTLPQAKQRLHSYFESLAREREQYVRDSKRQIDSLPNELKQQHPEGGLHVALGIAGTTFAFAHYIKASEALLTVLPDLISLCEQHDSTLDTISESINATFDDLLFRIR